SAERHGHGDQAGHDLVPGRRGPGGVHQAPEVTRRGPEAPRTLTERAGFEPATHLSASTRFPVALLRPTRTPLRAAGTRYRVPFTEVLRIERDKRAVGGEAPRNACEEEAYEAQADWT